MRFASILLATAAVATAQSPLTTTFANNNGQDGNMFDLVAINDVTVSYFEINCDAGTFDFEIYTKNSAYLPDVNNAGAWTLVGSATGVVGNGPGVPTVLPICVNQDILAGNTQAFYVTGTQNTFPINYTNGTTTGALFASNADLEFYEGAGLQYPFTANFNPRVWNGNIHYAVGAGQTPCGAFASISSYGAGCGAVTAASFYEEFAVGANDLADTGSGGQTISAINTGAGYLVQTMPAAGGIAPGATATALALGDDAQVDTATVGGTLGLHVGSNGWVAFGAGNSNAFTPAAATMLANPNRAIYAWTDLEPNNPASGQVWYEESGTVATITYDGVFGWGTTDGNTMQIIVDTATGDFSIEFGTVGATNPEGFLVGYGVNGPANDPGPTDLSALTGGNVLILPAADTGPLELSGNRPIIGSNWDLTTRLIDPVSPIAITFLGTSGPAVPFQAIGINAPGCDINLASALGSLSGLAAAGEATISIPVPNNPALSGQMMAAQSICLTLQNAANILSSNGVEGTFGQ